ncbi:MAG TPA: cytochrome c oxidase subunit 4 [Nocardioidaceae bacterium]|nr:cytochrome c oxidase subunit 4 [Nocardioidaceae bacterium]
MKVEAWIFGMNAVFFIVVAPIYWWMSEDWTGTSALVMTACLTLLVTFYLGFTARRMQPRPEDRAEAEIVEGAGELGFFPPFSWQPLFCAAALAVIVLGIVFGWWLSLIGAGIGSAALFLFVLEYYRGEHAH